MELSILFVGRVSPEKGVHVLLQAFPLIKKAVPSARLSIIGGRGAAPYDYICRLDPNPLVQKMAPFFRSDDTYQKWLDTLAADANGCVDFIPRMPHIELVDRYRRSDVFVFPSVWDEPFGIPVLEAMACGKPVVSTFSGGIPESVRHNETGLLVEQGNSSALAEAIIQLARDPSLRYRFGKNGRAFVCDNLTWAHAATRLMDKDRIISCNIMFLCSIIDRLSSDHFKICIKVHALHLPRYLRLVERIGNKHKSWTDLP